MDALKKLVGSVNGSGWLVHLIWTTVLLCGLYWKMHEEVAVLKQTQELQIQAVNQHVSDIFQESVKDRQVLHETDQQLLQADAETRRLLAEVLRRYR